VERFLVPLVLLAVAIRSERALCRDVQVNLAMVLAPFDTHWSLLNIGVAPFEWQPFAT
jgi:hypothetical protein